MALAQMLADGLAIFRNGSNFHYRISFFRIIG
jgi:hypothetical protein